MVKQVHILLYCGMPPVLTAHLFPKLDGMLIELLRSLRPEEWENQTVAPAWKVGDVAAHLLDTCLRRLSAGRDGHSPERPEADLTAFVNRLNREGVQVYRRLSVPVLISLMEPACRDLAAYLVSLDPMARATIGVSWAGERTSPNWFDIAREYTERWHHQQQIRLATHRTGLLTPELYHPVLDCFLRALPHHYRDIEAAPGTLLEFEITGDCGGTWRLLRDAASWRMTDAAGRAAARVTIPQETAWRLFTRGINRAAANVRIEGDPRLGAPVLGMTAIVA